jgi:hypothetical protein
MIELSKGVDVIAAQEKKSESKKSNEEGRGRVVGLRGGGGTREGKESRKYLLQYKARSRDRKCKII